MKCVDGCLGSRKVAWVAVGAHRVVAGQLAPAVIFSQFRTVTDKGNPTV